MIGEPFAATATAGGLVHVSGVPPSGAALSAGVDVQVGDVLRQLDATLRAAGSTLSRAVSLLVQLRRASDFAAMNAAYRAFFTADPPARTTVVAPPEQAGALVEISAVAAAAGTEREVIRPAGWPPSANPYSYAIRADGLVFLAGLVARRGRTNEVHSGDLPAQVSVIFDNATDILHAAGLTLADVVNARVFVTDAALVAPMNEAYRARMPVPRPSRATAVAALMHPQYLVEMTFIAAAGKAVVQLPGMPAAPDATLAQGVAAAGRVFVSGMVAAHPDHPVEAQTRRSVERLTAVLTAADLDWSHVAEATLYVTEAAHAAPARAGLRAAMGRDLPAGATLVTGLVVDRAEVEIMVSAVRP